MHAPKIFRKRPVRGKAAQRRLPGMHVGVDEPRDHKASAAVDDLGISCGNVTTDRRDAIAVNQKIGAGEIAQAIIHRKDRCRPD